MAAMPPIDYDRLATKDDLTLLAAELRGEMAELRAELRGEMAELRGEMHEGFARLEVTMARNLRTMVLFNMATFDALVSYIATVM